MSDNNFIIWNDKTDKLKPKKKPKTELSRNKRKEQKRILDNNKKMQREIRKQVEDEIRYVSAKNQMDRLMESKIPPNDDLPKPFDSPTVNVSYPYSPDYDYKTELVRINLDKEREYDIATGKGFIISEYQPINKEIKAENGIFSPKFGQTLADTNPFIDRYKCNCGNLKSRLYNGIVCPICNSPVKYVDDNYSCFGWAVLNDYYVIHPNLYKSIEFLIGSQRLINILYKIEEKDENGHPIDKEEQEKRRKKKEPYRKERGRNEPYYGIGMMEFKEKFVEICDYYLSVASNKMVKQPYYDDIMNNIDCVFTQSIPVFTTHLRPFDADKNKFAYEPCNSYYTMISKYTTLLNSNDKLKMYKKHKKSKDFMLFDLQVNFNKIYTEIDNILSGKKGNIRLLAGGRFNFSSRDVIVQDPTLELDQIKLPYWCLVDILQQRIINILTMTYNMSYNDAYQKWYKANIQPDDIIVEIIEGIIKNDNEGRGIGIIINRNPSIARGSLLQMHCIGMTFNYVMSIPLGILPLLAADSTNAIGVTPTGMYGLKICELLGRINALKATA